MQALIVCNGFLPSRKMLEDESKHADFIIGADGGGNILLAFNITPNVVIGDMDSFIKPADLDIETILDPDQETNDLEKALNYAVKEGIKKCTVLGAFGNRLDHSLKNLSVMLQFHHQFDDLIFKDEYQKVFLVDSKFEMDVKPGTIISLFPITGEANGIKTSGLEYALNGESLKNGVRDGTSNIAVADHFCIEVKEGALVVFVELDSAEKM